MTKREICERLLKIRDYVKETDTWPYNPGQRNLTLHNVGAVIAKDLGELLLDIAAPDDHFADAGKMVREKVPPGVIAKPGKDGEIEWCWCQKCYGAADVVHDPFGDGENWSYCKKCGVSFRLKRKSEEGRKEGVKQLYEIAEKVLAKFDFDKAAQYDHRSLLDVWAEANNAVIYSIEKLGSREGEGEVRLEGFIAKATRRKWLDESQAFTGRLGKICLRIDLTHEATGQHVSCAETEGEKNL